MLQVTKITAVLEQESWIAVDAPDEFQAIVDRFTYFDTTGNGFAATADTVVRPDSIEQAVSQHPQAATAETTGSDDRAQLQQTDEAVSAVKEKVSAAIRGLVCFSNFPVTFETSNINGQYCE